MHSTSNLNDEYIGSGRRLWLSINKHGKENHTKEILEFLENRQALKDREHQLVNDDTLKDPMCMNLQPGGGGGFCNIEHAKKAQTAATLAFSEKIKNDQAFRKSFSEKVSQNNSKRIAEGFKFSLNWKDRKHKNSTKLTISHKLSVVQTGKNNNQYGTIWITNGSINKKIKNTEIPPDGWHKGRIM